MKLPTWLRRARPAPAPRDVSVPAPKPKSWLPALRATLERFITNAESRRIKRPQLRPWEPMPGVVPKKALGKVTKLAMDSMPYGWINSAVGGGLDNFFKGYPYLAQLSQMPEYRNICQTIAEEMTRKGIIIKGSDDVDKDKLSELGELAVKYKVIETCRVALEQDGFFGRSHIYIDVKTPDNQRAYDVPDELEKELFLAPAKIKKGALTGFT